MNREPWVEVVARPETCPLDIDLDVESAFQRVAASLPAPALLDSSLGSDAAWSILTASPSCAVHDALPEWPRALRSADESAGVAAEAKADLARRAEGAFAARTPTPPFVSGWIGFLSHESASRWNRDLVTRPADPRVPLAWWGRYEASLAFRHRDRTWWISRAPGPLGETSAGRLLDTLRAVPGKSDAAGPGSKPGHESAAIASVGPLRADLSPCEHASAVETIREWIARGHIYQANLTYRVRAPFRGSGTGLYVRLRETSPAPFGAYLRPEAAPGLEILAASPELFLQIDGARIVTRPIKGTRPRDLADPGHDAALARELFLSAKDRAELAMIVDLERNDLGRVCRYGSVRTQAFPRLESYRGVHHLVATVEGLLRDDAGLTDIVAATFPGGSVTGAPKIRAMEILHDLECTPRSVYTGALGYLDDGGRAALSLTIRTLWITGGEDPSSANGAGPEGAAGAELVYGVGGGIVADSQPEREWEETQDKARTLVEALAPRPHGAVVTSTLSESAE